MLDEDSVKLHGWDSKHDTKETSLSLLAKCPRVLI
jgi:hypothetical protein